MKNYWLLVLIIAQPLLDVIAFFTASDSGTIAGYIRLLCLIIILVFLAVKHYADKRLWIVGIVCLVVFGGHILNSYRVGYISFSRDINYIVRVSFMPILAIFFALETDDDIIEKQILKGLITNTIILCVVIAVSYITGTYTYTYGEGLGISGWVTIDNRCCHSDILSILCIFLSYIGLRSKKSLFNVLLPLLVLVLLYTNGTRACYYTLYCICACFLIFIFIKFLVTKQQIEMNGIIFICSLVIVLVVAYVAYPYSARAAEEEYKRSHFSTVEKDFVDRMKSLGYDNIYSMSLEEKMSDPIVHEELKNYYNAFCWGGIHQIVDRFDLDTIIYKYGGTIDSGILGDTRIMKQKYASLIMDSNDILTHLFGFEIAQLGDDMIVDMENDWYAILYYYGYVGLAAYIAMVIYFIYRVISKLTEDFVGSVTDFNFTLLFAFAISLGLAYFSGAILRRPNASIYLSIILGMLYHETKCYRTSL